MVAVVWRPRELAMLVPPVSVALSVVGAVGPDGGTGVSVPPVWKDRGVALWGSRGAFAECARTPSVLRTDAAHGAPPFRDTVV
jgi:hypothetical protein